jgi:hypothetical protein
MSSLYPFQTVASSTPLYYNSYKLYNPKTKKSIFARDCKVIEGYYYKPNNLDIIKQIFTKLDSKDMPIELDSSSRNTTSKSKNSRKLDIRKSNRNIIDYSSDKLGYSNITTKDSWKNLYYSSIVNTIYSTLSNLEPNNYKEVLEREDKDLYIAAMQLEIVDLLKSNTWTLVVNNNLLSIIKGRWVLNKKYNLDNTIKKYKAR